MRRLATLIAGMLMLCAVAQATEPWRDADCSYRRKITIDNTNVDAALSNFTVLVKLADSHAVDKDKIADGEYTFWDASGNELDFENETYSEGASYVNMETWVEVQSIASGATTDIWIYYSHSGGDQDDGSGAWDADGNWVAVWHLGEASGGPYLDSTANDIDSSGGTMPDQDTGIVGNCQHFDSGASEYIQMDDPGTWGSGDATFTCWLKQDQAGQAYSCFMSTGQTGNNPILSLGIYTSERLKGFIEDDDGGQLGTADDGTKMVWNGTVWQHVGMVMNRTSDLLYRYLDGAETGTNLDISSVTDTIGTDGYCMLMYMYDSADYNTAHMDEARMASTARAAAWIKFAKANVSEADNEITVAAEETPPAAGAPMHLERRSIHLDGRHL